MFKSDTEKFKIETDNFYDFKQKRENEVYKIEEENKQLKNKLEKMIAEYESYCSEYKDRLNKVYLEEEQWRSKLTIQEEKDQYLKNKEIELQNVKKNMEQINDQEHRKIEELMAIIDKKGKEIQEKDE